MRRHLLALGVSALCLTLAPTLALGQDNAAVALAEGGSVNATLQSITQGGGGAVAAQTAKTLQVLPVAVAPAVAPQIVPVNVDLPVRIASPGDDGEVEQSNTAVAVADASNENATDQSIRQGSGHPAKDGGAKDEKGGGGGSLAAQSAKTVQVVPIAVAPAVAPQVVPVNVHAPIRVLSPGDNDPAHQSNTAVAVASAGNSNVTDQSIKQGSSHPSTCGEKGGKGSKGGGSVAVQRAKTVQLLPIALAPALAPQVVPLNVQVPIAFLDGIPALPLSLPLDPAAVLADPAGTVTGAAGDPVGTATGLASGLPLPGLPALPIDPAVILADPAGAVTAALADPFGSATSLLGTLPLGALPIGI